MNPYLTLLILLVLGAICSQLAKSKHRNPSAWFGLGIAFGIIALLILLILPDVEEEEKIKRVVMDSISPDMGRGFWYYLDEEKSQHGPMSFEGIKRAWNERSLSDDTYVWNESMSDWKPLSQLPGPFSYLRQIHETNHSPR